MFIYRIQNKITGKNYIGQTVQPVRRRWNLHRFHMNKLNRPLYASMRKHGAENFEFSVLETLPRYTEKSVLDSRECVWIEKFNAIHPHGYNLTSGGFGKFFLAQVTKDRIAASKIGKPRDEQTKEKLRIASMGNTNRRGATLSVETRAKIGAAQIGRRATKELKAYMSKVHLQRDKYNEKRVECIETGDVYRNASEAARVLGLQQTSISAVCRGARKSTAGLTFRIKD